MATRVSNASLVLSPELRNEGAFRGLVDSEGDYAIFLLDPTGIVATWSPGAERLKKYTADQIIGKHFSVFYPRSAERMGGRCGVESQAGEGSTFWVELPDARQP